MKKGNKNSQSRSWILTLPFAEYDKEYVVDQLKRYSGVVGQLEKSESGYEHWQVLIQNDSPIKFSTLRNKFPKGHFEPRKGSLTEAVLYCTKEETFHGERISIGEIKTASEQGKRTDLETYQEMIFNGQTPFEVVQQHPKAWLFLSRLQNLEKLFLANKEHDLRDVFVHYIFGEPGSGKTKFCFDQLKNFYRISEYTHSWDNYAGQKTLVLDEFCFQFSVSFLLNLLDRYPLQLPARYQNQWANWDSVFILSNHPIEFWFKKNRLDEVRQKAVLRRIHKTSEMKNGKLIPVS